MSKIALFEKSEVDNYSFVEKYNEKDYVTFWTMAYVLGGTLLYFGIAGIVFLCCLSLINVNISLLAAIIFMILLLLGYVFHMYFYLIKARSRCRQRYREGQEKLKFLKREYQVLDKLYQEEEDNNSPDWK